MFESLERYLEGMGEHGYIKHPMASSCTKDTSTRLIVADKETVQTFPTVAHAKGRMLGGSWVLETVELS
jgi:hypothetical protein